MSLLTTLLLTLDGDCEIGRYGASDRDEVGIDDDTRDDGNDDVS